MIFPLIRINGDVFNLNNVERIWRDTGVTPNVVKVRYVSGVVDEYALGSSFVQKLNAWSRVNPHVVDLTET